MKKVLAYTAAILLGTASVLWAGFDNRGFPGGGASYGSIGALYCALGGCTMTGTLNTPTIANAGSSACGTSARTGSACVSDSAGLHVNGSAVLANNDALLSAFTSAATNSVMISAFNGSNVSANNVWGITMSSATASIIQTFRVGSTGGANLIRGGVEGTVDSGATPVLLFDAMRESGTLQTPSQASVTARPLFGWRNNATYVGHVSVGGVWRTAGVQTSVVADNGAGTNATANLDITGGMVTIDCNDANGCDVAIQDTSISALGTQAIASHATVCADITNAVTVNLADNANQFNGAAPALGAADCITIQYMDAADDLWLQTGASNN